MENERRDLKPDAQGIDRITIETVPRYKTSGMSGDEWRIGASIKFFRKGKLIKESFAGNVEYATHLVGARLIELRDNAEGYFAGEGNICDQEGCDKEATIKLKKKFDFCKSGHKSEKASNAYRLFCNEHKRRGDCGLDDADDNYESPMPFVGK